MLVLSRKVNEQIIVGDNIRITVVSVRGNQVRIGLEAPQSMLIFRNELRSGYKRHESLISNVRQVAELADCSALSTAPPGSEPLRRQSMG
jgi:carbon storage regulator